MKQVRVHRPRTARGVPTLATRDDYEKRHGERHGARVEREAQEDRDADDAIDAAAPVVDPKLRRMVGTVAAGL